MVTLLFIFICIAFVGLGIPDSILGPAWPTMYKDLGFSVSYANFITTINFGCTVISSLFSGFFVKKFGTGIVTAVSTLLTALGLLGFALSSNIVVFCLLGIPMGLGAGAIDAVLNNYIATHYKAIHMSFLHCFYGVGVLCSPLLMSFALSSSSGWRGGYQFAFYIQIALAILMFLSIPLWIKVRKNGLHKSEISTKLKDKVGLTQAVKNPLVRWGWLIFIGSVGLEFTCGIWSGTFLNEHLLFSPEKASLIVSLYYVGITVGRFISGIISTKIKPWTIIVVGQIFTLIGISMMFFGGVFAIISVLTIGLGNGPLFPNMTYLTPENFGKENSQSIIGTQMAACNISIVVFPNLFGLITEFIGVWLLPVFLLFSYGIMILGTIVLRLKLKKIATI